MFGKFASDFAPNTPLYYAQWTGIVVSLNPRQNKISPFIKNNNI